MRAVKIPDFSGRVATEGDSSWDADRQAFNLAVDQRPAAVVHPTGAADVAAVVRFAAQNRLRVAPQATGHNAMALALEDALLVKTAALDGVEIDAEARRARVGAGVTWGGVVDGAAGHGLAGLHGSSGTVGVTGYSLMGGIGWYARRLGLQSNAVTAVELVSASGEQLRVDADEEPELFWALRGGAGNFGLVTALEFELFEIAEAFAGMIIFPWERSLDVLRAWHEQTAGWSEELTSSLRILQVPDIPTIPDPLRAGKFVVVDGALTGSAEQGAELVAPLRALGEPVLDTWGMVPAQALQFLHMDPPDPAPAISVSRLIERVDEATLEELVALSGPGSDSPLAMVELRHLGGALARAPENAGALAKLDGEFLFYAIGIPMSDELAEAIRSHLAKLDALMAPASSGRYLNFTEGPIDLADAFDAETLTRLRAVRAAHDPDGLFLPTHEIKPA